MRIGRWQASNRPLRYCSAKQCLQDDLLVPRYSPSFRTSNLRYVFVPLSGSCPEPTHHHSLFFLPLMMFFLDSIFILSLYPLSLSTFRNGWVKPWKPTWRWRASLPLKGARNILVTLTPVKTTVSAQGRVPNTPVSANLGGLVTTVIRILMNALEVLISFTYFNNPVFETKCGIPDVNWTSL